MVGPSSYFTPSRIDELAAEQRELVGRRERLLGNAYRLFYDQPVEIVRGSGTLLYDADGTEYLDVYNNVPSVGHSHPRVVEAIARQAAQLNTHTRYLNRGIVDYSSDLLATLPDGLDNAMFTCTGSEANDLALRLAKAVTGHAGVIVTRNAYHGVTTEIAAISPSLGGLDTVAPWVRVVEAPVGDGLTFVRQVAAAINELRDSPHGLAAVIVDTIFASDGVRPAPTAPGSPAFSPRSSPQRMPRAASSSPTRCRPGSVVWAVGRMLHTGSPSRHPASGGSVGTASCPTSSHSENRWAMACRLRRCSPGVTSSTSSVPACATSTRSAATRCQSPRRRPR